MLLNPRHNHRSGARLWATLACSVLGHVLASWALIHSGVLDTDAAESSPAQELQVRVLTEDDLPRSLRRVRREELSKTRLKDVEKPKPKEKKKFKDPRQMVYQPVDTAQPVQKPDEARFSGRQASKTPRDQIKRGTEGSRAGTNANAEPVYVPPTSPARQAMDTKRRDAAVESNKARGEIREPTPEDSQRPPVPLEQSKDGRINTPKRAQVASPQDIIIGPRKQSGVAQGSREDSAKDLFPTVQNTEMLASKRGDGGIFNAQKDIPDADRTLLNRKRTRYWTFFDRVKRQISREWKNNVVKVYKKNDPYGNVYGIKARYAVVQVTLKSDGSTYKLHIHQSSGLEFYDDEAIRAINAAAPFPNPPEGLKDEDGQIHFKFGFVLTLDSGATSVFRIPQ